MRRIVMLAALVALVLTLAAGVALAATVRCDSDRCSGTNQSDRIFEQQGDRLDDFINAKGKGDFVDAADFTDDEDDVRGMAGNDRLRVDDGDVIDFVNCGTGNNDIAIIDEDESQGALDFATANCEEVRTDLDVTAVGDFSTASADEIIANSDPVE